MLDPGQAASPESKYPWVVFKQLISLVSNIPNAQSICDSLINFVRAD